MTDVAIVTTTINYPEEAFKKYSSVGQLIVVGDLNTPSETATLVRGLDGVYLSPDDQEGWQCSDTIGWRCIQRRNIGFLEAARLGSDVVITIDDDNCPEDAHVWRADHLASLQRPTEYVVSTDDKWYNPGKLLYPRVHARGMPYLATEHDKRYRTTDDDTPVGVNCGLWLGDPDIDAMQRITAAPETYRLAGADRTVVSPHVWSPINSQNTAWRRELLPLTLLPPHIGRWDDILGGYIAEWSMWANGYAVAYGEPLVRQDRNDHNLWTDLRKEIDGLEYTVPFCNSLSNLEASGDALQDLAMVADYIGRAHYPNWPVYTVAQFIREWIEDWESIL